MKSSPAVSFVVLAVVFFGGGGAGLGLAGWLAPDSDVAAMISFLMLPAALIAGFHTWLGLALLILLPRILRRLARQEPLGSPRRTIPPGSWSFVPVSSVAGLLGGVAIGLLSARSAFAVALVYWVAATAYGLAVWRLAELGYLPFPESD